MAKVELMSPAGSFDALKAAVNYGADAVYLGGTNFSARAFANNFNHEELVEAVKYCHLRGVKVYVTLNTLLNEIELENALNEARFYYENNVDALIIQDLGLFYRIKQEMPDFPLAASTQMHIHNVNGVRNAKELGFKRVVLARESSLDLIKEACKEDIEIECFIHGAICVSYSGQCLMSSLTKHRSANKGMCAQCCRLKYQLIDKETNKKIKIDTDYLLSPKDMYLLEDIPDLIEAGVSSFKIEGRLKSPAYVGLVTKIYREAIDAYYDGKQYSINNEKFNELLKVFNRGFSNTYLRNNNDNLFGNIRPNHLGKEIGRVIKVQNNKCYIELNDSLNQFDGIRIISDKEDLGKILNVLSIDDKYVSSANANEIINIEIDGIVKIGDKVVKTLDAKLEDSIVHYRPKKRPININASFKLNEAIKITAKLDNLRFNYEYPIQLDIAKNKPLSKEELFEQFSKTNESPFELKELNVDIDNVFIVKSKLNEIRRDFYIRFEDFILNSFKRPSIKELNLEPINVINHNELLVERYDNNISLLKDPVINQKGIYNHEDVCSEFGHLLSNAKTVYYTMNIYNSYAYELLCRLGYEKIVLSSELSNKEIELLIKGFKNRNSINIKPYVLIYGKRTLMYLKRNPFINYINDHNNVYLSDGINKYSLRFNKDYTEILEYEPFINKNADLSQINGFIIIENDDISSIKNELKIVL